MYTHKDILLNMVLEGWQQKVEQVNILLTELTDAQLMLEIAPRHNRGIYVLGHITASNDRLFRLFDICSPIFPQYEKLFILDADNTVAHYPAMDELKQSWFNVTIQLTKCFAQIPAHEWFRRNTFLANDGNGKGRHRNKLQVLQSGTIHLSEHYGQLLLLKYRRITPAH